MISSGILLDNHKGYATEWVHHVSLPGGPPPKVSLKPASQCWPNVELGSDNMTAGQRPSLPLIFCWPRTNLLFSKEVNGFTKIVSVST